MTKQRCRQFDYLVSRLFVQIHAALSFSDVDFDQQGIRDDFTTNPDRITKESIAALDALQEILAPFANRKQRHRKADIFNRLFRALRRRWRLDCGHQNLAEDEHDSIRTAFQKINSLERRLLASPPYRPECILQWAKNPDFELMQESRLRLRPKLDECALSEPARRLFDLDLGIHWNLERYADEEPDSPMFGNGNPFRNDPMHPFHSIPFSWLMWIIYDDMDIRFSDLPCFVDAELITEFVCNDSVSFPPKPFIEATATSRIDCIQRAVLRYSSQYAINTLHQHAKQLTDLRAAINWICDDLKVAHILPRRLNCLLQVAAKRIQIEQQKTRHALKKIATWLEHQQMVIAAPSLLQRHAAIGTIELGARNQIEALVKDTQQRFSSLIDTRLEHQEMSQPIVNVLISLDIPEQYHFLQYEEQYSFDWDLDGVLFNKIFPADLPWVHHVQIDLSWEMRNIIQLDTD